MIHGDQHCKHMIQVLLSSTRTVYASSQPLLGRARLGVPGRSGAPAEQRACTVSSFCRLPRMNSSCNNLSMQGSLEPQTSPGNPAAAQSAAEYHPASFLPARPADCICSTFAADLDEDHDAPQRQLASPADTWPPWQTCERVFHIGCKMRTCAWPLRQTSMSGVSPAPLRT